MEIQNDDIPNDPGKARKFATVTLRSPVPRGEASIKSVQLRCPKSGELRGLSLVAIARLEVDALAQLIPRITTPPIFSGDVTEMDPRDLLAIGGEIASFFED